MIIHSVTSINRWLFWTRSGELKINRVMANAFKDVLKGSVHVCTRRCEQHTASYHLTNFEVFFEIFQVELNNPNPRFKKIWNTNPFGILCQTERSISLRSLFIILKCSEFVCSNRNNFYLLPFDSINYTLGDHVSSLYSGTVNKVVSLFVYKMLKLKNSLITIL